ncbi:MAG TPA: thioredoxin family protein [Frateuria sp.]|uniref:thioredoxin family protein n=1 Tax=Frateuria sp. TaxID=2211372 RepID=UPI002D7E61DA|nr:thioredoxin family protein [Frateuria sp.]HET6806996.1 thioredoxin family protein [Frateuria sp.]
MSDTSLPQFFTRFPMRRVDEPGLDTVLAEPAEGLTVLFLWGRDCPNCDMAKGAMLLGHERFQWPRVRWLHDNVYEDPGMATRFGLHGIPAFIVFAGARKLGRITSWPGTDAFVRAIDAQLAALSPAQG